MNISRRKFLAAAPLAAGAVLQLNGLALGQRLSPSIGTGDPLSRLTWNSFYPYVTSTFTFSDKKGNRVDLQLTEMTDMKPADFVTSSSGQECFALTFTGPSRRRLPQDTYAVEHFALGGFALFITVGESSRKNVKYFAIINR